MDDDGEGMCPRCFITHPEFWCKNETSSKYINENNISLEDNAELDEKNVHKCDCKQNIGECFIKFSQLKTLSQKLK